MTTRPLALASDRRAQQGGLLFLTSLLMFFLGSILIYVLYAVARRGEPQTLEPLPATFLLSTALLLAISGVLHVATRAVRREQRRRLVLLLAGSVVAALAFMALQMFAMWEMMSKPEFTATPHKGVFGMVIVLAVLHGLHVAGGVIALALVASRAAIGRYDHERYWAIDFSAMYWHFLDAIWLCMLVAFWVTTGGVQL
ncbi:cytochrome c oxidase subunit 3 [Candidatus Laterigemmans baculatus]|uniref:cytochrome c oxidase subunit 3 n=1 Tax=Candidatus Laterigemmans baculatus TaxID=2770505 RepID=UPI0013DB2122|nr:cytochrome c oxidase subunit 3 [Candidatus Laterigemmans baculatus]